LPTTSGEDSLGPIRLRQRSWPQLCASATTSPSVTFPFAQSPRLSSVTYTVPCLTFDTAGADAAQRRPSNFHARLPVRALMASTLP
jgi:hypothetical protein